MKKPILITLCCATLMLVTPLTSIAQENKVSSNLTDSPDIDGLVTQIRTVVDEILQKYSHIPIISSLCNIILNTLSLIGNVIICIFLIMLAIPIFILYGVFKYLRLDILLVRITLAAVFIGMVIYDYCSPFNKFISKLPFQSLYTLSEPRDITNLARGCPCLQ